MNVEYAIEHGIGRVRLAGEASNALDKPYFEEPDSWRAFLERPELKGVVLTGNRRHFCAGANLETLELQLRDPAWMRQALARARDLLDAIYGAPVPVVAAIRGSCLGGGLEIALACHFRVASRHVLLGFPESGHDLIPGLGGLVDGREVARRAVLVDLALTGRIVGAQEALALGLVDRVVPTGDVEEAALGLIGKLVAGRRPELIRAVMRSIDNAARLPRDEALREEIALFLEVASSRPQSPEDGS